MGSRGQAERDSCGAACGACGGGPFNPRNAQQVRNIAKSGKGGTVKSTVEDGGEPLRGPRRGGSRRLLGSIVVAILSLYLLTAFVIMPMLWHRYETRHPAL